MECVFHYSEYEGMDSVGVAAHLHYTFYFMMFCDISPVWLEPAMEMQELRTFVGICVMVLFVSDSIKHCFKEVVWSFLSFPKNLSRNSWCARCELGDGMQKEWVNQAMAWQFKPLLLEHGEAASHPCLKPQVECRTAVLHWLLLRSHRLEALVTWLESFVTCVQCSLYRMCGFCWTHEASLVRQETREKGSTRFVFESVWAVSL